MTWFINSRDIHVWSHLFLLLLYRTSSVFPLMRCPDQWMINRSFVFWHTSNYHLFFFFPETASFWELACIPKSTPIHHGRETMAGPGSCTSPGVPLGGTWILLFPISYVDFEMLLFVCWHFITCTRIHWVRVPCQREKSTRHPFVHPLLSCSANSFLYLQASPILDEGRGTPHKPLNWILFQGHRAGAVKKCFQGAGMVWVIDTFPARSHPCVLKYKLS